MAKKQLFFVIILLYILPSCIQVRYSDDQRINGVYLGLPMMQTGDEPHYYITLYSLVNDGDFFLTNNYDHAFYKNCPDLGKKRWTVFDRHTRLFNSLNKTITNIPLINPTRLNVSVVPKENSFIKEIPGHPIGLPLFALVFLWPFKHTSLLEPLAIYLTMIWSILGIFAFYEVVLFYHKKEEKTILFTALFACATQYWYYSKTFWAEPYLASFLMVCWYLVVIKRRYALAGMLLGFGFLMKYPFALAIVPFYLLVFSEKTMWGKIKAIIFLSLPLAAAGCGALYLNYYLTGNPLQFNQINAVSFINPIKGIPRWFFDPAFGLFTFSPFLLCASAGVKKFLRKNKMQCLSLCVLVFLQILFWGSYAVTENGAGGYSARYLTPIIPFLVLLCSFSDLEKSRYKIFFYSIAIISVVINVLAAFAYPAFIDAPIWVSLYKIVQFTRRML